MLRTTDGTGAVPAPRYLTITELSAATGFSISTLQRLRRKGVLPFYQPGGSGTRIVFPPDAVERAKSSGQATGAIADDAEASFPEGPKRGPRPKWLGARQEGVDGTTGQDHAP